MLTLEQLLDERNKDLYDEIARHRDVTILHIPGKLWREKSDDRSVTISVAESNTPSAAFAHELLHAKLEIAGMREPYSTASEAGRQLVHWLYESFVHMRMSEEFINLEYKPEEFFADIDVHEIRSTVPADLKAVEMLHAKKQHVDARRYAPPYLMLSVPPELSEFTKWRKHFEKIIPAKVRQTIDDIVTDWRNTSTPDIRKPIGRFLTAIGAANVELAMSKNGSDKVRAGDL